jgi:hypothetical protein
MADTATPTKTAAKRFISPPNIDRDIKVIIIMTNSDYDDKYTTQFVNII